MREAERRRTETRLARRIGRRGLLGNAAALALAARARAQPTRPAGVTANVQDHGAKGDYSSDDTDAIQRALDAVNPDHGGTVFLPPGGYRVSRPLLIRYPSTHVHGAGRDETHLVVENHTFDIFVLRGADNAAAFPLNNITIEDLWIHSFGNGGDPAWVVRDDARSPTNLTRVDGTPELRLRRLQMNGIHSGVLSETGLLRIDGFDMRGLREGVGVGIELRGNGELRDIFNVWMGNPRGHDAAAGIIIRGGAATTLFNCEIVGMGTPVHIVCGDGQVARSIQMLTTWCDTSSGPGMVLETSGTGNIGRVAATTCWFGTCRQGIVVNGNVWGLMVSNSQIVDNAQDGVFIAPGSVLRGASFNQVAVAQNLGSGFRVGRGVGDFSLTDSILGTWGDFHGNGQFGCIVEDDGANGGRAAADGYIISGNRIRGNGKAAQLHDGGSGASKIVRDNIIAVQ